MRQGTDVKPVSHKGLPGRTAARRLSPPFRGSRRSESLEKTEQEAPAWRWTERAMEIKSEWGHVEARGSTWPALGPFLSFAPCNRHHLRSSHMPWVPWTPSGCPSWASAACAAPDLPLQLSWGRWPWAPEATWWAFTQSPRWPLASDWLVVVLSQGRTKELKSPRGHRV